AGYTPPAATGTMFTDAPTSHPFTAWIEQLANEGVTSGCGGGNFCPNNPVTRAQMAVFIQRVFNLPMP
ncbi:MAG: S-layer homology domain-containing protein, partial [Anaerolineales bacterium]|nr:S-layer homology domain-containing protein [Anaerolineales bacterium]